jgi:hypothetical protein
MKKKIIFWVMLVMVLAFGMTVVGCDDLLDQGPKNHKITITGIDWKSGDSVDYVSLYALKDGESDFHDSVSFRANISNNAAVFPMSVGNGYLEGKYRIRLNFFVSNESYSKSGPTYYYTDGETFVGLGITQDNWIKEEEVDKLPAYKFPAKNVTIDLSKFAKWSDGDQ